MNSTAGGITIAVVCYNSAKRLQPTLEHLLAACKEFSGETELLIVDNASTDDTVETARRLWPERDAPPLRIVREPVAGAIHARLRAFREASFDLLTFVDDDNWVTPNWITEVVALFEKSPELGVVAAGSRPVFEESAGTIPDKIESLLAIRDQYPTEGIVENPLKTFWTAGSSFRVDVVRSFLSAGFTFCLTGRTKSKPLGGEDHELCYAFTLLGFPSYYSTKISFEHFIPRRRLTAKYLESLVFNQAQSQAILDIYRRAVSPGYKSASAVFAKSVLYTIRFLPHAFRSSEHGFDDYRRLFLSYAGKALGFLVHSRRIGIAKRNISILRDMRKKSPNT